MSPAMKTNWPSAINSHGARRSGLCIRIAARIRRGELSPIALNK
jgi:hypothetical protein